MERPSAPTLLATCARDLASSLADARSRWDDACISPFDKEYAQYAAMAPVLSDVYGRLGLSGSMWCAAYLVHTDCPTYGGTCPTGHRKPGWWENDVCPCLGAEDDDEEGTETQIWRPAASAEDERAHLTLSAATAHMRCGLCERMRASVGTPAELQAATFRAAAARPEFVDMHPVGIFLAETLLAEAGGGWARLMYAYPTYFDDAMIDAMARLENVVDYIDIPLQHASDRMLEAMRRNVGAD